MNEIIISVLLCRKLVEITEVVERVGNAGSCDALLASQSPSPMNWSVEIVVKRRQRLYNHRPSLMNKTVTVRSFAKINLGLRIGAAREDGFHELLTVYQTIALHDVIRVSVGRGSRIAIQCEDPRVPKDETNTCWRIAEKALASLRAKGRVVIEIEKRLPVQGGLGGASANAVACLIALERALKKSLPMEARLRIAAEVGSDLPLFLVGGTVLGVGRGEQVYPLPDLPAMACVVVTPEVGVSTPKAFADWDRMQGLNPDPSACLDAALKRRSSTVEAATVEGSGENSAELFSPRPGRRLGPTQSEPPTRFGATAKLTVPNSSDRMNELGRGLSAWLSQLHSGAPLRKAKGGRAENPLLALVRAGIENDFEQVVFPEYPVLGEGKRALMRAGAKYASLSGSGSTLFGLFVSRVAAVKAAAKLRKEGWSAQVTTTLPRRTYWRRMFAG
jgi:4-diphosphocytidyl-2-C-methyl-D-erythritol kinase